MQHLKPLQMQSSDLCSYSNEHQSIESILIQTHRKRLLNGKSNNHNRNEIIESLGGIDTILSDYLNPENKMSLTENQLQSLHQILTSDYKTNQPNQEEENSVTNISIRLNKVDTVIHSIFNFDTACNMVTYIYNKLLLTIIMIINFIWVFLLIYEYIHYKSWSVSYYILKVFCMTINTIYGIFIVLTVNQKALIISIKSFEFWFKMILALQVSILHVFLKYHQHTPSLEMTAYVMEKLTLTLLIITFATIDGYQASLRLKIFAGIGISLGMAAISLYLTFIVKQNDNSIVYITSNIHVSISSLFGMFVSGFRLLAIFLWKQTMLSMLRPGKCVNLRYSPRLQWIIISDFLCLN
eukprot:173873_1